MTKENKINYEHLQKQSVEDRKAHAKERYFKYDKMADIAQDCAIRLPTLKSWIYGIGKRVGWKAEREIAKNQLLKDMSADKRGMVFNMVNNSLYLLYDYIDKQKIAVIKSGNPIDIKTAEKITVMLGNLHKLVENDTDSDSDPNFVKPTSIQEVIKRVKKADPFNKPDIDVKGELIEKEHDEDDDIIVVSR